MLKTRLATAAVALPVLLAAIFLLPGWAFSLFIFAVGLWGLYEIVGITGGRSRFYPFDLILVGIAPLILALVLPSRVENTPQFWIGPGAIIVMMLALVVQVGRHGAEELRRNPHATGALVPLGTASVGFLFPYFALVRNKPNGIALLVLLLLLVICTDSGAYFVGRAIGRHKLAFKVSPGKTLEGAIGGILASMVAGLILRGWLVSQWNASRMIVFAAIVAVLAIVGDLANSAFKRVAGVKDSGWIFPGHGGLLDRTCSLVFAAVLTYYYSG